MTGRQFKRSKEFALYSVNKDKAVSKTLLMAQSQLVECRDINYFLVDCIATNVVGKIKIGDESFAEVI